MRLHLLTQGVDLSPYSALEEFDLLNFVQARIEEKYLNNFYDKINPEARDIDEMKKVLKAYAVPWLVQQKEKQAQAGIDDVAKWAKETICTISDVTSENPTLHIKGRSQ